MIESIFELNDEIVTHFLSVGIIATMALTDTQQNFVDHTSRFFTRIYVSLLISIFDIECALIFICTFAVLFDTVYNGIKNNEWDYLGQTAESDKFLRDKRFLWYAYKLTALIVLVLLLFFVDVENWI